jgi:DNA-binding NarL/FixJ family response regulator
MFDFSYNEYQYFMERCPFTDEEIEILNMKRRGKSNIYISVELHISERTVTRRLQSIQNKILKEIS